MFATNRKALHVLLLLAISSTTIAISEATSTTTGAQGRRRLKGNESISQYLRRAQAEGDVQPQFTIVGQYNDELTGDGPQEIDFDVIQAQSAVTEATTYSISNGEILPVPDTGIKFLVSDYHQDGSSGNLGTFSFFAVDENAGTLNGISQTTGGEPMNIAQQTKDPDITQVTTVTKSDAFVPPNWTCGVTASGGSNSDTTNLFNRRMETKDTKENDQHSIHEDDHHSGHNHFPRFNSEDKKTNFASLMESLNGHIKISPDSDKDKSRGRNLYATDNFPAKYSYEVRLYIEIDAALVTANNNDLADAITYVNSIVTAASSIYEREIDTHCEFIFVWISFHGIHNLQ